MQLTRLVRALGLLLVLGLAGSVVGCGPGAPHRPTAEEKEIGKRIAESMKKHHQQQLNASTQGGATPKDGGMRRRGNKARATSGH